MDENKPLVSVVMITYGHENYIRQAIEGVFMQKTDFPVEFIIANDASPDSSDEIIREIIKKAPSNIIVKYTRHDRNIGMMPNFIWSLRQATGKYTAICKGAFSGIKQMENMNFCLTFLLKKFKDDKVISGQISNYMHINDSQIFARKVYDNIHNHPSEIYSNLSFVSIIKLFVYKVQSKIFNKKHKTQ